MQYSIFTYYVITNQSKGVAERLSEVPRVCRCAGRLAGERYRGVPGQTEFRRRVVVVSSPPPVRWFVWLIVLTFEAFFFFSVSGETEGTDG